MPQLVGLPGTKKPLTCQRVASVEHAVRRIQKRRAVTAAGSNGAINVWRDDTKQLRSAFCRYRATLAVAEHADLDSLRRWLEEWWPQLEREAPVVPPRPGAQEQE